MNVHTRKMLRSALSLLLAVALIASISVSAFAEGKPKKYLVSLGDSMTNGYGLKDYEANGVQVNGYLQQSPEAYPAQFLKYLQENEAEFDWELIQLAVSCTRAEDLNFILNFDWNDPDQVRLGGKSWPWNAEEWYNTFEFGDKFTWEEFTTGRYNDYSRIDPAMSGTAAYAKNYQESVAKADIVTLSAGNSNFGVFMLRRVLTALGIQDLSGESDWLTLENAFKRCGSEAEEYAKLVAETIDNYLRTQQYVPYELADELSRVVMYTVGSYLYNYTRLVERIVELNPDAEIIALGLMNTMEGVKIDCEYEGEAFVLDFGAILDQIIEGVNMYLAGAPAAYQLMHESDAKILFAEPFGIDVMENEFAEGNIGDPDREVVRKRMISGVCDLMGISGVTLDLVKGYEAALALANGGSFDALGLWAYSAGGAAQAVAMYYGMEKTIEASAGLEVLNGGAILSVKDALADTGALFTSVNARTQALIEAQIPATVQALMIGEVPYENAVALASLCFLPGCLEQAIKEDEALFTLMSLYGRFLAADGIGSHPSAEGHDTLTSLLIDAHTNEYTVQNAVVDKAKAAMEELIALLQEYGPEAVEEAWAYAEEAGYVDAVKTAAEEMVAQLRAEAQAYAEELKPQLEAAKKALEEQLAALNEELKEKEALLYNELEKQLNAVKAELEAKKAELEALEPELRAEAEKAIAELKNTIAGLEKQAEEVKKTIAELESKVTDIKAAMNELAAKIDSADEILDKLFSAAEDFKAELETIFNAKLESLDLPGVYEQVSKALEETEKAYNELSKVLPVIENEAGMILDAVVALCKEIYAENSELAAFVDNAYNTYAADYEQLKEALENISMGLAANVSEDVRKAVTELNAEIEKLNAEAEKTVAAIRETLNNEVAAIEAALQETTAALQKELDEVLAMQGALEAQIAEVGAELAKEKEALGTAAAEAKAAIEGRIAELEKSLAESEDKLGELQKKAGALQDEIAAAAELAAAQIAGKKEAAEAQIAEVWAELAPIVAEKESAVSAILDKAGSNISDSLRDTAKELLAEIQGFENALDDATASTLAVLAELNNALLQDVSAAGDDYEAAIKAAVEKFTGDTEELIQTIREAAEKIYDKSTLADYIVCKDSYFVSVGDKDVSGYAQLLLNKLKDYGMTDEQYKDLSVSGMRAEDLRYILNSDYSFGADTYADTAALDALREEYIEEISKADLITVSFDTSDFIRNQLRSIFDLETEKAQIDWTHYVGAEAAAKINETLVRLEQYFAENGFDAETTELLMMVVEGYAYSYVGYTTNLAEVLNSIHALSPTALVIVLGNYNPMDWLEIKIDEENVFGFGGLLEGLTKIMNSFAMAYVAQAENNIYVSVSAAESVLDSYATAPIHYTELVKYINAYANQGAKTSKNGTSYMFDQIMNSLNVSRKVIKGDVNDDGVVDINDVYRLHKYVAGGYNVTIDVANSKVNGDDVIDINDVLRLHKYVAGGFDAVLE